MLKLDLNVYEMQTPFLLIHAAYFWVHSWWEWESSDDYSPAIHVCEIQTLTNLNK